MTYFLQQIPNFKGMRYQGNVIETETGRNVRNDSSNGRKQQGNVHGQGAIRSR